MILVKYAKLSIMPVSPIAKNKTEVERGSIVDRSGFPLAVQTNFYHVGVSVKNIRDNAKLKESFAEKMAPALEMTAPEILAILNTSKSFVYLRKKVTPTMFSDVKKIKTDITW